MINEDLEQAQKDFEKRVGREEAYMGSFGIETSLGHAYSVLLEVGYRNGIDLEPNSNKFLNELYTILERKMGGLKAEKRLNDVLHDEVSDGFIEYMKKQGLNKTACQEVMAEIVGPKVALTNYIY